MVLRIKLAIGLGNQNIDYSSTRHNVGHRVIDFFKSDRALKVYPPKGLTLFKNPGYMNSCGIPIAEKIKNGGYSLNEVLIVCDDFSIPLGTLRIRLNGSSGGHNGLKSIIDTLGTENFPRLRVGIGPVPPEEDPADFVLEPFRGNQIQAIVHSVAKAANAVTVAANEGLEKAMNQYNGRETE